MFLFISIKFKDLRGGGGGGRVGEDNFYNKTN